MGLDFIVSMGVLGAFVYYVVWRDWLKPKLAGLLPATEEESEPGNLPDASQPRRRKTSRLRSPRSRRVNTVRQRSPRSDAEFSGVQRSASVQSELPATPSELPATVEELQRLAHALEIYATKPNKQAAIETAFGCKKGAGPEWRRASSLFDLARKKP